MTKAQTLNFTTIVLHIENLELRKDTGQIPYHFGKIEGFDSTLVSYYYSKENGSRSDPYLTLPVDTASVLKDYPYLNSEVPGLDIHFLPYKGRGRFYEKAVYDYLAQNAKQIDCLNLFHFGMENIFYTILYKLKNPGGKVYLKLDINVPYYEGRANFFNAGVKFSGLKSWFVNHLLQPLFFKMVHTISAESAYGLKYFRDRFKVPENKMALIPNGIDEESVKATGVIPLSFEEKENLIITVGKIGDHGKNNRMLLNSLADIDLKDWKVYFIGGVENGFEEEVNLFITKYPQLKGKVFLTGRIDNPAALYSYYNRAKIFCLTSLHEGFPLSACEAAYFGNYLILTDTITCFPELTNSGQFGSPVKIDDFLELGKTMALLINCQQRLKNASEGMAEYAKKKLTWQAIIPELNKRLFG